MKRALLALACVACGDSAPSPSPHDGFQRIDVVMPDATTEPMWIYVASPPGDGPFPVVIYGHGQGGTNALPACAATSGPPTHVDVDPSVAIARALAAEGYLGVAVFYPGFGEPPVPGRVVVRDHFLLDARAFLSAARWARDTHEKGSERVAFMGNSMGSYPATWAISSEPALADLQAGLDLRTAVASGMLGNHVANSSPQFTALEGTSLDDNTRLTGILLFSLLLPSLRAAEHGDPRLDRSELADHAVDLTPAGLDLVTSAFFADPPANPACDGVEIAYCSQGCLARAVGDVLARAGATTVDPRTWFTSATFDAFAYWAPPLQIDPPTTAGSLLERLRTMSPAYSLANVVPGVRMLPLVSTRDHTLPAQTGDTLVVGEQYLARLRGAGVSLPDPVPLATNDGCDHGDYYRPDRPDCGWGLVLDELAAAF